MTDFLQDHLGGSSTEKKDVQVVLTYAQSLDGCIAGRDRTQMALSGAESMAMTHRWVADCGFRTRQPRS